jgi:3',5'-cyclic AMP phosphodiesterase CpdA
MRKLMLSLFLSLSLAGPVVADGKIWTYPYLQNVTPTSADVYWVSEDPRPLVLHLGDEAFSSLVRRAEGLGYNLDEVKQFNELSLAAPRFLHKVELSGLSPNQAYNYRIELEPEGDSFLSSFSTPPDGRQPYRFVAYADSETEPESQGAAAPWPSKEDPKRRYLVDQTTGYRANLEVMLSRKPHAVVVAGDLVESGGEQRDWDEFWSMNTQADGSRSLASQVPILPAIGNHEYFGGPNNGKYSLAAIIAASRRYFTYFHPTGAPTRENFYSVRLGPARLISLDSCDGTPHRSAADPNYYLNSAPKEVPGIQADSRQTKWLEKELAQAQKEDRFTFVVFHHCPYSSGPHGLPPGESAGQDPQSGQPLRAWTPMFMRYGVDVVLSGHDEMFERSSVDGMEIAPGRGKVPHTVQFYDVGVGGDGLRSAVGGAPNPQQRFLAETSSPERWENGVLIDGGRHYGHLEVNIEPAGDSGWTVTLEPVYVFPIKDGEGWRFERRVYDDKVYLRSE